MQKIKNFIMKFGSSFAALALIIGITNSNFKKYGESLLVLSVFFNNPTYSHTER